MRHLMTRIQSFATHDEGATMVEYGLMVALIAIACIGAVALVGTNLKNLFQSVGNSVNATP
jgi:pilus assembly protein Flp/PilA